MDIVKVKKSFMEEYQKHTDNDQMLESEVGRPCVLIMKLKYKGKYHKFIVPLRSNITGSTPKNQFFSLPPTSRTRQGNRHGISYVKIFPIKDEYVEKFLINPRTHIDMVKKIIDKNENTIIYACQNYLNEYEKGNRSPFTPDIDSILTWL